MKFPRCLHALQLCLQRSLTDDHERRLRMMKNQAQSATHPRLSAYAAFVSAPTLEFARTMTVLSTLAAEQRLSIATGVLAHIQSIGDLDDDDELSALAEGLQKQRWKLVFEAADDLTNPQFWITLVTQTWLQAQ